MILITFSTRAEVINEVFHFIYTKNINNFENLAEELIVAANKFQIFELKDLCEEYLCKNLTNETVIKYFVISDIVQAQKLKGLALEFIITNRKELINSAEFQAMVQHYPHLKDQVFFTLVSNFYSLDFT